MHFIEEFKKGQLGGNKGLSLGKELQHIDKAINGVQKGKIIAVAGASKSGKSTFVDYAFVIQMYLDSLLNNIPLEIIYYSFEIDRVSKEFDFATYFLFHDYGIENVILNEGVKYTLRENIMTTIPLSSDYLRGRLQDDDGNIIKVKDSIKQALITVYQNRIIPLFGEYSVSGKLINQGLIKFITNQDNPTGIYKGLLNHANENGVFIKHPINHRLEGYVSNNKDLYTIVIVDHVRKVHLEQGFQMKQAVDKLSEYMVILRNLCNYTFVPIIHTNRNGLDTESLKYAKDELYPTSENLKDSGNIAEDCNYLFTIFSPNDEKYRLQTHFGLKIKDNNNNPIYPNMKTIHLVESRHCIYPQHFRTEMIGNLKTFKQLKIK